MLLELFQRVRVVDCTARLKLMDVNVHMSRKASQLDPKTLLLQAWLYKG